MAPPKAIDQMFSAFAVVHDPRRQHPTTRHSLAAILTITLLATICGAHHWVEIEPWGHAPAQWLAEFLDRTHGLPSHETCGRVLAVREPTKLQQALRTWMSALAKLAEAVMALAGKTLRRSLDRADGPGALHVVRAWASRHALVLAQLKVDDKSHAITALPQLLARLNLHGSVVTSEAMGCPGESARQSGDHGGDDVLSLKAHQPRLHRECDALCAWLSGPPPVAHEVGRGDDAQVDGGHGRLETRKVWSTAARDGLRACERWPGLTTLVRVESTRQGADQASRARRDDISSLPGTTDDAAQRLRGVSRTHWEIDNRVPGVLDVAMGEETNRTRAGASAQNLAFIRKLALQLLRRETSVHVGIAAKQKRAGWDHHDLLKILAQT